MHHHLISLFLLVNFLSLLLVHSKPVSPQAQGVPDKESKLALVHTGNEYHWVVRNHNDDAIEIDPFKTYKSSEAVETGPHDSPFLTYKFSKAVQTNDESWLVAAVSLVSDSEDIFHRAVNAILAVTEKPSGREEENIWNSYDSYVTAVIKSTRALKTINDEDVDHLLLLWDKERGVSELALVQTDDSYHFVILKYNDMATEINPHGPTTESYSFSKVQKKNGKSWLVTRVPLVSNSEEVFDTAINTILGVEEEPQTDNDHRNIWDSHDSYVTAVIAAIRDSEIITSDNADDLSLAWEEERGDDFPDDNGDNDDDDPFIDGDDSDTGSGGSEQTIQPKKASPSRPP